MSGYVKPGTLTALMGASGAGKTTCLDVLAQRKNVGIITGSIQVDGRPPDYGFARSTAYGLFKLLLASLLLMRWLAEQMDVHEGKIRLFSFDSMH